MLKFGILGLMLRLVVETTNRLDKFLVEAFPQHSRSRIAKIIEQGEVLVNSVAERASCKLKAGDVVELEEIGDQDAHDLTPHHRELEVLFEDESLLIVNKPRGLASHPAVSLKEPSLVNVLLGRGNPLSSLAGDFRPGIVHRLDKETTGLMVVAKNDATHAALALLIEKRDVHRRYFAVVAGELEQEKLLIDAPMARHASNRQLMTVNPSGKSAITHVKKIARVLQGTLVGCRLQTGRTHQIRVHMRAIGNPVIGDSLYAPKEYATGPMQLHAGYLAFEHPVTGESVVAFCSPPEDFMAAEFATRQSIEEF